MGISRMRTNARAPFGLILLVVTAGTGQAQVITPIDQSRSVAGFVIVPPCGGHDSDGVSADDFGPFVGVASSILQCEAAVGFAEAHQRSSIGTSFLVAQGNAVSKADANTFDVIHAIANSFFEVTFGLTSATGYSLRGELRAAGGEQHVGAIGVAGVSLRRPGGAELISFQAAPGPNGEPDLHEFRFFGRLDPGTYILRATADAVIDTNVPPSRIAEASFRTQFSIRPLAVPECSALAMLLVLLPLLRHAARSTV